MNANRVKSTNTIFIFMMVVCVCVVSLKSVFASQYGDFSTVYEETVAWPANFTADLNDDDRCDGGDIVAMASCWLETSTPDFTDSPSDADLCINLNNRCQKITMMGGDMERSQSFLPKAANPGEIAKWCFGDIPFDTCRVSYDKKQEEVEGTKNFSFYDNALVSMKLIKNVNPSIKFWATMKSDYNGYGKTNNLPEWICDDRPNTFFDCEKYAGFLADYLEYMEDNGVPITYISVAKEWIQTVTADRTAQIIPLLDAECEQRGITVPKHIDPASWGVSQGAYFIKKIKNNGYQDLFYGFSTHNLNSSESDEYLYEKFVERAVSVNKYAYADETHTGGCSATSGVEKTSMTGFINAFHEKCEYYKDGIEGEVFFEIFSRGYDNETRPVYFHKGDFGKRMRAYYLMQAFASSFTDEKYYISTDDIGSDDDLYSMSFASDESVMCCIINGSSKELKNFTVCIEGKAVTGKVKEHLFTIDGPITGIWSWLSRRGNQFVSTIPAKSIVFYNMSF